MNLTDRMVAIHRLLVSENLPHAFGGALALGFCVESPRATSDIDINVFVGAQDIDRLVTALSSLFPFSEQTVNELVDRLQVRVHWDDVPIDLFLNWDGEGQLYESIQQRVAWHQLADVTLPFLGCFDLARFKASFNRRKDWADIEAMLLTGNVDFNHMRTDCVSWFGADDPRITALDDIADDFSHLRREGI